MYINKRAVKKYINSQGKQITSDGLHAIEEKVERLLGKLVNQFNGDKPRLNAVNVNLTRV